MQRVKAEAKTASGLLLPESSVKELNEARVLAVGPGGFDREGKRMPMGVSAGDRVLIPQVSPSVRKRRGEVDGRAKINSENAVRESGVLWVRWKSSTVNGC